MATNYIAPTWRMPENTNKNKFSNYSINFDGNSDYIDLGANVLFDSTQGFTASAWIYLDSYSTTFPTVLRVNTDQSTDFIALALSNQTNYKGVIFGSSSNFNTGRTTGDISGDFIGAWKHVCLTFDGVNRTLLSSYKIYVDGSPVTIVSAGNFGAFSNENNLIGFSQTNSNYFNGKIDQVCVFDYELLQEQVTYLYNLNNPMAITGAKPIAYYPLGDNSNPRALAGYPNLAVGGSVFNFIPNDHINLGNNSNLSPTSQLSVSAWVKDTGTSVGVFPPIIANVSTSANKGGWILVKYQNKWRFYLDTTGNSGWVIAESNGTVVINSWQHLCATWDGSTVILYLNGQPQTTTASASQIVYLADTQTVIGEYRAGIDYFGGEMSNIALFNTALQATGSNSVETIYNNGAPRDISSLNPVGWWKLNASEIFNSTSTEWSVDNNAYPSVYQSSLNFNGNTQAIDCGVGSRFDIDQITISNWVKFNSVSTNLQIISGIRNTSNGIMPYTLSARDNSGVKFRFLINQSSDSAYKIIYSNDNIVADTWYHVVGVADGSNVQMYVNGDLQTDQTTYDGTITSPTQNFNIGRQPSQPLYYLDGQVSNVAVFDTGLSLSQVETLYNNGTPEASISHSPVSWWKLDNTTTGLIDNGSASNNGTNIGTTEYAGFVNALAGESVDMDSSSLVQSNLYRTTPYSNYSVSFHEATEHMRTSTSYGSYFSGATSCSVSVWVKVDSTTARHPVLSCWYTSVADKSYLVRYFNDSRRFQFYLWGPVGAGDSRFGLANTGKAISANRWYHIVGTWDGTTIKIYQDGVLEGFESAPGGALQTVNLQNWTGRYSSSYMQGDVSNQAFWKNTALTQSEITEIYNAGVPTDLNNFSGTAPNVWYPMDENSTYFPGVNHPTDLYIRDVMSDRYSAGLNMNTSNFVGNAPGSSANGTGNNLDISNLKGNMINSTKNSYSINMADYGDPNGQGLTPANSGRTTDVPGN